MEIVYGPVSSWRLKKSLGVDLICREDEKICSFDCTYCSLGKTTEKTVERRIFLPTDKIEKELKKAVDQVDPDIITMSGTGEPTLAKNLGEAINVARESANLPVSVLTNSSLMNKKSVRKDLAQADIVIGSLDASDQELLEKINNPSEEVRFQDLVQGMKKFREEFKGKFAIEVMFVPENLNFSKKMAEIIQSIDPNEVQLNTPLRNCPVRPLTPEELQEVEDEFGGMKVRTVYSAEKEEVKDVVGLDKLKKLKRGGEG